MSVGASWSRAGSVALITALLAGSLATIGAAGGGVAAWGIGAYPGGVRESAVPRDAARDGLLPDLVMATTTDLRVITSRNGREQLRFTSTLQNLGDGPLVVAARRAAPGSPWRVVQQLIAPDGSVAQEVPVAVDPVWGGDGHNHWHVPDMALYRLRSLDDGQLVGTNHKIGFCFFDNAFARDLPNTPREPEFPDDAGCAHGDRAATHFRMGLSVGFADVYRWRIPGQSIDITELPAGRYRLEGTANSEDALFESDTRNNVEWVDFELVRDRRNTRVRVLDDGWTPQTQTDRGTVTFGSSGGPASSG